MTEDAMLAIRSRLVEALEKIDRELDAFYEARAAAADARLACRKRLSERCGAPNWIAFDDPVIDEDDGETEQ